MNRLLQTLLLLLLLLLSVAARAQIGIGTITPDAKAALDIRATDKGLLIPRLTAGQRAAISSPPQGLMVYQTDGTASGGPQTGFWYYAGSPAQWVFLNPAPGGGSLTLPYAGTTAAAGTAFSVTSTAFDSPALEGVVTSDDTPAVKGRNTSATGSLGIGVQGTVVGGTGVVGAASGGGTGTLGESVSGTGLLGSSITGVAVKGSKIRSSERGRVVEFTNQTPNNDSTAAYISSAGDRPALRAVNTATSGQAAIRGVKQAAAADGIGVEGVITSGATGNAAGVLGHDKSGSGTGSGVLGLTAGGYGVRGIASANGGYGVSGSATNSYGVIGSSQTGSGVYGVSNAPGNAGAAAVLGNNTRAGGGVGVRGVTLLGVGVVGETNGDGDGVLGRATTGSGLNGISNSGNGVYGSSSTNSGVYGTTSASGSSLAGVEGNSSNSSGTGVLGTATSGYGVRGTATGSNGYGVFGSAAASNGIGVFGSATGTATGVTGQTSGTGRAGYFNQNNPNSTAAAVEINQSGTGPALNVTGGAVRTTAVSTPPTGRNNMLAVAYGGMQYNASSGVLTVFYSSGNFTASVDAGRRGQYNIVFTPGSIPINNFGPNKLLVIGTTISDNDSGIVCRNSEQSGADLTLRTIRVVQTSASGNTINPPFIRDEWMSFSFVVYAPAL